MTPVLPYAQRRDPTAREADLSTKPYITCRQLIDFIASYLDQKLPEGERAEFERHLAVCPSCQAYLSTYRQTVALTRAAAHDEPPENVPEALIEAILSARGRTGAA